MSLVDKIEEEDRIVKLEGFDTAEYVREAIVHRARRRGRVGFRGPTLGRKVVGYGELHRNAEGDECAARSARYPRRLLYLEPHDRALDPTGVYVEDAPLEAVDPTTVRPGVPGRKTRRCTKFL